LFGRHYGDYFSQVLVAPTSTVHNMDASIILLTFFGLATIWLLYVSRTSLRILGSHGFYRFFAWEAILALVLLNIRVWFIDPLAPLQIVSWIMLLGSILVLVLGVRELRLKGKSGSQRLDDTLMEFEKTSSLVTSGVYRFVRHPLYASLFYLAWGAFLKDISWYTTGLVGFASFALVATANADEKECIRYFGAAYEEYMKRTKMFVPFLF
jgi:protein-S-isoprenylcysteine O-methyltransferase Ste14